MAPEPFPSHSEPPDQASDFFRFFTAAEGRVQAYILAMVPHRPDADEIFQETCVAMWRDFPQFIEGGEKQPSDFLRWSQRIAFHRVLSFRKQRRHTLVYLSDEFIDCIAQEVQTRGSELDAQLQALADCVRKLSPRDQQLLSRRYTGSESIKEVAASLNRPADTVYKALGRIRQTLFECVNRILRAEEQP